MLSYIDAGHFTKPRSQNSAIQTLGDDKEWCNEESSFKENADTIGNVYIAVLWFHLLLDIAGFRKETNKTPSQIICTTTS